MRRSTRIITAFVRDGDRFLLVRRSNSVKTMKGLWAAVSGVIEGGESPLERAKIEIYEELGIGRDKIRMTRSARSVRITSPQYRNHEWEVYPFLFEARRPRIRLNWENSEYVWVAACDISGYRTVPRLVDVLLCLL